MQDDSNIVLQIKISISSNRKETLTFYPEIDDPEESALLFCVKHSLDFDLVPPILDLIKTKIFCLETACNERSTAKKTNESPYLRERSNKKTLLDSKTDIPSEANSKPTVPHNKQKIMRDQQRTPVYCADHRVSKSNSAFVERNFSPLRKSPKREDKGYLKVMSRFNNLIYRYA